MRSLSGIVDIWEERDGSWRWAYRDRDDVEVLSNKPYESAAAARAAARAAYPDAPVAEAPPRRRARLRRFVVIAAVVAVLYMWLRKGDGGTG